VVASDYCRDATGGRDVVGELVVAAAEVLHEGVPGDGDLRGDIRT
jgi:hypothetical protein